MQEQFASYASFEPLRVRTVSNIDSILKMLTLTSLNLLLVVNIGKLFRLATEDNTLECCSEKALAGALTDITEE